MKSAPVATGLGGFLQRPPQWRSCIARMLIAKPIRRARCSAIEPLGASWLSGEECFLLPDSRPAATTCVELRMPCGACLSLTTPRRTPQTSPTLAHVGWPS